MKKFIFVIFMIAYSLLAFMGGYVLGGFNAVQPTVKAIQQCEQALPRNEECVVIVLPKFMLRQAPTAAPTRV